MKSDAPALFLDASSTLIQVGLWQEGRWLAYRAERGQPLEIIFTLTQQCLTEASLSLDSVETFIYNEGPGSVLGIRLSAMAIEGWRALPAWKGTPVYAVKSLPMAASLIEKTQPVGGPYHVIAESRQGRWNVYASVGGLITEIEPEELADLQLPIFHLSQRKTWHEPPAQATAVDVNLAEHAELLGRPGLLHPVERPGVFQVNTPTYQTWTPERHRG
ncbi:MAG: hypothetical protein AAGA45_03825 [Verrucomicrobiota bacterium]